MIEVGKVTAVHGLHLRKRPSTNSEVLSLLPLGTVVNIDSRSGNWLQVTYNFKTGYIYKNYVAISSRTPVDLDIPHDTPQPHSWTYGAIAAAIAVITAIASLSYCSPGG